MVESKVSLTAMEFMQHVTICLDRLHRTASCTHIRPTMALYHSVRPDQLATEVHVASSEDDFSHPSHIMQYQVQTCPQGCHCAAEVEAIH